MPRRSESVQKGPVICLAGPFFVSWHYLVDMNCGFFVPPYMPLDSPVEDGVPVLGVVRHLKARWTREAQEDLLAFHFEQAEEELLKVNWRKEGF